MREITLLDQNTIDKIAAGEVVERPASVVKELVENAIDAAATAVTVEIRDGGMTFLRVTDNGAGIPAEQVRLAFLRHATSKIRRVEDLTQIASLGFRGEALSSISAVAQVECITKTADSLTGVRMRIDGGQELAFEEIGAPDGTTIVVRNLFFNTPARAKFLRSAASEGGRVSTVTEELALSHPEISFKYILNGRTVLYTSGNGNLQELVYQIFGKDTARNLLPVALDGEPVRIRGFIGEPQISRGNRSFENFFVNGRFIRSDLVSSAVEEGFRGFLMQHRFPFALLYLEIDGTKVDVNVHPAKMEVRFSDRELIYRTVSACVREALMARERIPEVRAEEKKEETAAPVSAPEPYEAKRRSAELEILSEEPAIYGASGAEQKKTAYAQPVRPDRPESADDGEERPEEPAAAAPAAPEQQDLFEDRFLGRKARSRHRIIGQIFSTYFLVEYEDSLFIVDQHAAHEKVLYERLMRRHREKNVVSQQLFPAEVLSPGRAEAEILREHLEVFYSLGFEIEPFGGDSFRVTAVPADLYSIAPEGFFRELLDNLEELRGSSPEVLLDRLATMSCKAAVKGHDRLSVAEADALLDELMTLENPYNCPHGRPTIISMPRREIEKKFGRIV